MIGATPSVSLSFREAKEPVDSRWPHLESPTKKREESKSQKDKSQCANYKEKVKVHKRRVRQERDGKSSPQDIVSDRTGTQYQ